MELTCKFLFFFFKYSIWFWLSQVLVAACSFPSLQRVGLLFVAVYRRLIAVVASLVAEHRLQVSGLQWLWCRGLVAPRHMESSGLRI